jgi:hypothetical protein
MPDFESSISPASRNRVGVPMGSVVSLPGGITITREQLEQLLEGSDPTVAENNAPFLGDPSILFREPKKGAHYGWPIRNVATQGKCYSGAYRVVAPEELRDDIPFEVSKDGSHVEWYNHILVEIQEDFYKKYFVLPAWRSTVQLARLQDFFAERAKAKGLSITPTVTMTASKV